MLGLIAFALLILACSYWKLSSRLEDREGGERDLESGGGDEKTSELNSHKLTFVTQLWSFNRNGEVFQLWVASFRSVGWVPERTRSRESRVKKKS
ncbi:protein GLUTAMINE DUMPER 1-like [Pyrus ussuriensis x Pyrus communis]|uniref:Protein GLUTAMINE DUMPER 1-like n=1 Tax=Pyrus ussuriensis x Pyrus communis TaxID=2448454 RepID=A0A5N5IC57_9ROSA|nr:protein GLUTAMINE DUMPER 1-like [Pyrus ussuriensis x Pyrus communis]